ncbi:MAG: Two-component transcriptional response regulator, LuxR family [uncultured Sphingosinicella sp.]|uniref:Two-component transcriptional response regulator, LuxR family n=1 Tax=uncultured Sphingosinicella sp. TaxID=478748 RepID=A0A6J4TTS0_9SPHN|nr:response regulator [uncultured Sphingosinicella sp.]CAA9532043.1 MAG: Two-component transcriptional response regulator, LuxR family [uncultured Sphingosinicella sp.]
MTARILYVDDEADIREIACLCLELDPDLEVRSCASGAEALDVAREWRPALILLDVMMPGMDGPETFRRLQAQDATGHVPVVFITARTQAKEVEAFKAMGAVGVIAKPFEPMTLAAAVRAFMPL